MPRKRKKVRRFEDIGKTLITFGCVEKPNANGKKYFYDGKIVWGYHFPSHTKTPDKSALEAALKQVQKNGFGHMVEDLTL